MPRVLSAIEQNEPITFVLPAFPVKSPNAAKVLGRLPDMAERCALDFLVHLCEQIRSVYAPGARVLICSDGRVFSDVIGADDGDVTVYQAELLRMMHQASNAGVLKMYCLDDAYGRASFDQLRQRLVAEFGQPIEELRNAVRQREAEKRLYCGITRFMLEDALFPGQTLSRSALQRVCRDRAYEVIRRSQAWGELLADRFPDAVRLSIHPQGCGSKKLGIRLNETGDSWLTPWHGVAVAREGRFVLMKRAEAEALGARIVSTHGRPSHYELVRDDLVEVRDAS